MNPSQLSDSAVRDGAKQSGPDTADGDRDRIIDGLRYPRQERHIDQLGYELTKHNLHFHGADWDIPLTQRRDDLTRAFIHSAAAATGEQEENIRNLRFIVTPSYLDVKLSVRHKAHIPAAEVQQQLSTASWRDVKQLYEPRKRLPRPKQPAKRQITEETAGADDDGAVRRQTTSHNLSFFGRANVGPQGPEFHDHFEVDEEPPAYEDQLAAKSKRTTSRLYINIMA